MDDLEPLRTFDELQALEHRTGRPRIVTLVWRGTDLTEAVTTDDQLAGAIEREAHAA